MRLPASAQRRGRALRVDDAAARDHPVHRARPDRLHRAEAVAVQDLALVEVGERGEPDMRVRAHVEAAAGAERGRTDVVEEDERPDHPPLDLRKHAADGEAAEILGPGFEGQVDGHGEVAGHNSRVAARGSSRGRSRFAGAGPLAYSLRRPPENMV